MKIGTILLLMAFSVGAQVVTTNFLTSAKWFREVNGQLYNTRESIHWRVGVHGKIVSIQDGGVVVIEYHGQAQGFQHVFLKHYVEYFGTNAAVDQLMSAPAMLVGTTNVVYKGQPEVMELWELWDCGTPHVVPVIVTNR